MDTTQNYSNIIKALQSSDDKLTPAEKVENYDLFKKLNDQGIKLSDLIKKAEQTAPQTNDAELFSLMESTVKNEPEVKSARQRVADVKSEVLAKICYGYPEYKDAIDNYRKIVASVYKQKANTLPQETKVEKNDRVEKPSVIQIV